MAFIDTIYLLQVREFIGTNIFKIGRTYDINSRYKHYPKNSRLLFYSSCSDSVTIEKKIIYEFLKKYKQRKDIGTEYFEGDYTTMVRDIKIILHEDIILPITKIKSICDTIQLRKNKNKETKQDTVETKQVVETKQDVVETKLDVVDIKDIETTEVIVETTKLTYIDLAIIEKLKTITWKISEKYKRLPKIINDFRFKKLNIISQKVKEFFIRNNVKVEEDKKHGHKIYIEY